MADTTTDQDTQQPPAPFSGLLGMVGQPAPPPPPPMPPATQAPDVAPQSPAPATPAPGAPAPRGPAVSAPGAQPGFPMGGMNGILRQLPKPPQLHVAKPMPPDPYSPEFKAWLSEETAGLGDDQAIVRKYRGQLREQQEEAIQYGDSAQARRLDAKIAELEKLDASYHPVRPSAPTYTDVPGVPASVSLRPFGDQPKGSPVADSLDHSLAMLGLMATQAFGLTQGYAQGANAAFQGALDGWAKGDAIRAGNEWKKYDALVNQIKDNNANLSRRFRDEVELTSFDKEEYDRKARLFAAKEGLLDKKAELAYAPAEAIKRALTDADRDGQQLDLRTEQLTTHMSRLAETRIRAVERREDRRESREQIEAAKQGNLQPGGPFIDKNARFDPKTGEFDREPIASPTIGEFRKGGSAQYVKVPATSQRLVEMLPTVMPNLNRADTLVTKLLKNHTAESLVNGLQGQASQKLMNDSDWLEFDTLTTDLTIELTSVLGSGGQFRIGLMHELQRSSGISPRMVAPAAHRRIELIRGQVTNRVNRIIGQPMQSLEPGEEQSKAPAGNAANDPLGIR